MFGKNIVIGLDVGSFSVKAVALQANKGRVSLLGYTQQVLGEQEPSIIIRQVVARLGCKSKSIVSGVSGRSVIVRQVETPRISGKELSEHILIEADKYIPFGADEVVLDCQELPDLPDMANDPNQQVQLVAVRRGFIEDHISLLKSANAYPKIIDLDIFALINAYETFGSAVSEDLKEAETIALVDIGASKVCVAILKGTRPLFTREFYISGNEITDAISRSFGESVENVEELKRSPGEAIEAMIDAAMPALEDIANEIRLSFDYTEGQFDESVSKVVLTGGTSQLTGVADVLGNILGCATVVFDPISSLDLLPSKYDIQTLDSNSPSLSVALGLACHLIGKDIVSNSTQMPEWHSRHNPAGGATQTPLSNNPAEETVISSNFDNKPVTEETSFGQTDAAPLVATLAEEESAALDTIGFTPEEVAPTAQVNTVENDNIPVAGIPSEVSLPTQPNASAFMSPMDNNEPQPPNLNIAPQPPELNIPEATPISTGAQPNNDNELVKEAEEMFGKDETKENNDVLAYDTDAYKSSMLIVIDDEENVSNTEEYIRKSTKIPGLNDQIAKEVEEKNENNDSAPAARILEQPDQEDEQKLPNLDF